MATKVVKCPSCGSSMEVDELKTSFFCMYCGTKIVEETKQYEANLYGTAQKVIDEVSKARAEKMQRAAEIMAENKREEEENKKKNPHGDLKFFLGVLGLFLFFLVLSILAKKFNW